MVMALTPFLALVEARAGVRSMWCHFNHKACVKERSMEKRGRRIEVVNVRGMR